MSDQVLLTTSQIASLFGVSASTVCRWTMLGMPCERRLPSGQRRYVASDCRAWVRDEIQTCAEEDELEDDETDEDDEDETDEDEDEDDEDDDETDDDDEDDEELSANCSDAESDDETDDDDDEDETDEDDD